MNASHSPDLVGSSPDPPINASHSSAPAGPSSEGRIRMIERIAADVGHAVRSPLQSLYINIEVLRRRIQSNARQDALERTDVIEKEVHRIAELLEAFMIVLLPSRSPVEAFDLDRAIDRIAPLLELLAREHRRGFARSSASVLVCAPQELLLSAMALAAAAVCDTIPSASRAELRLSVKPDADAVHVHIESVPPNERIDDLASASVDLAAFLRDADGTITLDSGSPARSPGRFCLRVPRADACLTEASAQP
ncbi:MAG: hypothetical protein ACREL7_10960 [Longimicrobiales bacterium]